MATVRRVLASNPGPFTGPGTNTWVVGDDPVKVVIDPGPDDDGHLAGIEKALGGAALGIVLVTHSHADHLELAERLAADRGARSARFPELTDGDVVLIGNLSLTALHTPGHAPDHLAFWMAEDRVLFSGDLVLGRGSSMVTYPEGDVAAYLRSLDRVAELEPRMIFPGHWDPVMEASAKITEYREHRLARERQILEEVRAQPGSAQELTRRIYVPEVGESEPLLQAAELTLRAHLRKLVEEGQVTEGDGRYSSATR